MTNTRNPNPDLAKLRKADLIDLLRNHYVDLVENVEGYEGCDEGKIEFLRDVGVPDDFIAETFDLRPPLPSTILVTVAIAVNDEEVSNPDELKIALIDALDDERFVDGHSTYVVSMEQSARSSVGLSKTVEATTWVDLPHWDR